MTDNLVIYVMPMYVIGSKYILWQRADDIGHKFLYPLVALDPADFVSKYL